MRELGVMLSVGCGGGWFWWVEEVKGVLRGRERLWHVLGLEVCGGWNA